MNPKLIKIIILFALFGCSESKFDGETKTNGTVESPAVPDRESADAAPAACDLKKDFVSLDSLPPEIKECEDSGGFFFYLDRKCYNISQAKEPCTFDQVKQVLSGYNIGTSTVDQAIEKQAKIIDCRQVPGKKTLAVNWWYTDGEQDDCDYNENLNLVTACYRVLPANSAVQNPTTPEEHAAMARDCLGGI
jgi:hypothetical protein